MYPGGRGSKVWGHWEGDHKWYLSIICETPNHKLYCQYADGLQDYGEGSEKPARIAGLASDLCIDRELSSCHCCLLMNVKYGYRYKTRCCCCACSKIDLGRLEVLNEQSIVLTIVTWGILYYYYYLGYLNSYSFCICT